MSSRKNFRAFVLLMLLTGVIVASHGARALAASASWTTASSGNWSTGSNWTGGSAPNGSTDNATFTSNGAIVTVNGTFSVNNLIFTGSPGSNYFLTNGGSLNLYGDVNINVGNNVNLANNAQLVLQKDVVFNIDPLGSLSLSSLNGITGNHGITLQGGGSIYNSDPEDYTGPTIITHGTFGSSGGNVFSPTSDFSLADNVDAILSTCGGDNTIGSLSGGAASSVNFCGGRLTVGNALDTTYAGTMQDGGNGGGGITKVGTGKLTLTGNTTYTGNTIVNAGTLAVNGTITNSTVVVNSGGTLKGSGTLKAATVNGTLAPGNSIATINGDTFELANGSTLENEINPNGTTDLINATTSVTIDPGATLRIVPQAGTYTAGQTYTIISAGSITGTFSTITGTSSDLTYQLKYFPTHVDLVVSPASGNATTVNVKAPNTGVGVTNKPNALIVVLIVVSVISLAAGVLFCKPLWA